MSSTLEDSLKKKLSRSRTMSTILIELEKNPKILRHHDLNYFVNHLKEHYNSLLVAKSDNKEKLDTLKFQEKKYESLIRAFPQESPDEIQGNNSFFNKNSLESFRIQHEKLNIKKTELSHQLEKEIEFNLILTNQLKNDRENLNYYNDQEIQLREKLKSVAIYISDLESNKYQKSKKSRNFAKINEEINKKIKTMNSLISMQNTKGEDISNSLKDQKTLLIKETNLFKTKQNMLEIESINQKNRYKDLFRSIELSKSSIKEKENKVIKTVLGLDLIKRFFIDKFEDDKEESTKLLYESEEYRSFKNLKLNKLSKDNNRIMKKKSSMPNLAVNKRPSVIFEEEEDKGNINFMEIKRKFDSINVDFNQILDFHTKVLNKKNFNHNLIMRFNLKVP